jgi:diguanylate cyclase
MTGLRNRLGVAYQLHKWWREDPERQRLMSVALIDFERLGKTNEFASTRVADRFIQALADLLKHQVSRDSGFDRVFRYNGHQFLLFFGDVGHDTAMSTVERIRQHIAAARFDYKGKQYSLTIRAGVTAMRPDDDTETLLQRLAELATFAKHDGGNHTCTDNGANIDIVPPPTQDQPPRTVTIE